MISPGGRGQPARKRTKTHTSALQRHGAGTAVIEGFKAEAAALGIPVDLDVEKDNPGARKLSDHLGFIQVGETEQEYRLRWDPPAGGG